jgi:hypothetical protein
MREMNSGFITKLINSSAMEHQASNLWVCTLLPNIKLLTVLGGWSGGLQVLTQPAAVAAFPFLVQSLTIPHTGVAVERKYGINFISDEDIQNTVSMELWETEQWAITNFLKFWLRTFHKAEERYFDFSQFPDGEFKANMLVMFFSKAKITGTSATWAALQNMLPTKVMLLSGVFPTKVEPLNLSYSGGEGMKVSVNFAVDAVIDSSNDPSGALTTINAGLAVGNAALSATSIIQSFI